MMGSFAMIMMMLLSGNSTELLDVLSARSYWQAKGVEISAPKMLAELKPGAVSEDPAPFIKKLGAASVQERDDAYAKLLTMGASILPQVKKAADSPDAEIAARAQLLLKELGGGSKAAEVRRLMAIRTLGELKDSSALPELKKLLDSKTLFEAEYAARAIASIEGKPAIARAALTKEMKSDLALLPQNCGLVFQASMGASDQKVKTTEDLIKSMSAMMGGADALKMLPEINKQIIELAEKIGNVRVDGATIGLADNVGSETGFVIITLRGLYEPAAVRSALADAAKIEAQTIGKTEFLKLEREFSIVLPSNDRVMIIGGPRQSPLPLSEIASALETGKGTLGENKALGKLIASIDTTGPVWGAAIINESYHQAGPLVTPFDTVTLTSKKAAGKTDMTLVAKGSDANEVAKAVGIWNAGVAMGIQQTTLMVQSMPGLKPIADLLASIKTQADGATVTITASLTGDNIMSFISLPFTFRASAVQAENRARTQIQQNAQPAPQP